MASKSMTRRFANIWALLSDGLVRRVHTFVHITFHVPVLLYRRQNSIPVDCSIQARIVGGGHALVAPGAAGDGGGANGDRRDQRTQSY